MRILVIDDEKIIAQNIKKALGRLGYVADVELNGEDGLFKAETEDYDLVIVDWMLPDMEGPEISQRIKKVKPETLVLMLTAKSQLEDKIEGFEKGADDYLTKPFAIEELLMRIKAIIRRKNGTVLAPEIIIDNLSLNTNTCQVVRAGQEISLSPKEYALLEYLVMNKCKVLDRLTILEHVWGDDSLEFSNTVDVHIRYLRRKLDSGRHKKLLKTVINKGYMICDN